MTVDDLARRPAVPRGTVLGGRYELGEQLGAGGFATVYAGRDTRLGRPVAIKVLRPDLAADAGAQAEFQVEAAAAAMLTHPGIVVVHDVGADDVVGEAGAAPLAWIAMERVRGRTLREVMADGPADLRTALHVTGEVLAALEHAHRHGIVHRDISPGNVMITDDGTVKVLDFGLAVAPATAPDDARADVVRGSVAYVSPEQAQGLPADHRSDLYSTGCLLFALVTGAPPYLAATVGEVATMHVTAPVPAASQRRPEVPAAVDALLASALAKEPSARPASAAAMRAEVRQVADGLGADDGRTTVIPRVSTTTAFVPVPEARRVAERRRYEPPRIVPAQPLVEPWAPPPSGAERSGAWSVTLVLTALAGVVALVLWLLAGRGEEPLATVTVPDVTGQTAQAARQTLDAAGMRDGSIRTEPHDSVPAGQVIRTDPAAGRSVPADTAVLLLVSGGPEAAPVVAVPQLEGATLAEARDLLDRTGLVLGELRRRDSARPADTVLVSGPAVGASVQPGAVVTLTLASGNQVVPAVVGQDVGVARAGIQDAGFQVAETPAESDEPAGTVLAVQPAAGASLRLGSTVTLVVATGASPTADPGGEPDPSPSTPEPTGPSPTPTPTGPSIAPPETNPSEPTDWSDVGDPSAPPGGDLT
ncbi:Stk1 family PASTA domain-containing Ser/Thr kinase [Jiangella asiatica]|uniref:Stk1 family PASTA domain-containing Ser/Thr kinase n=1 Tax=Jiangella asiatica TaxID=2530372 RepID=UPI0013A5EC38|nr:Stk1 family PASTA domain-containing Ser/Thr kinase [Jiangella asiatica]